MTNKQRSDRLDRLRAWVAALRSGEFKQTTHNLRDQWGHCCLGVACEVYRRRLRRGKWLPSDNVLTFVDRNHEDSTSGMPAGVSAYFGFQDELYPSNPEIEGSGRSFAELNDTHGYSFKQIARVIERKLIRPLERETAKETPEKHVCS